MAVVFLAAERASALRILLPIVGPLAVGVVAFAGLQAHRQPGGPIVLMVPALFVLIPGDYLCAATAEIAVGQLTPGAVRLAQAAFTLLEIASASSSRPRSAAWAPPACSRRRCRGGCPTG